MVAKEYYVGSSNKELRSESMNETPEEEWAEDKARIHGDSMAFLEHGL